MQKTPLNTIHKQLGARLVDFAGWEMPVQYQGVIEEHHAVRNGAGIFDVSHMGEILLEGPGALAAVQKLACNDASRLKSGESQYSAFLTERATFVDDIIVNRLASERFLICVNASNTERDFEWAHRQESSQCSIRNVSADYFQIALQGPQAVSLFRKVYPQFPFPEKSFTFTCGSLEGGQEVLVARTGYTGEDGCEIYGPPSAAESLWKRLAFSGAVPCGLGARDTLRLEAALSLYGHEIDDQTHPYEARLGWIVKLDKGDFIGREALQKIKAQPLQRKLVGLQMKEPGIARQGYAIFSNDTEIGHVTSGTKSPTLDRAIALGYVQQEFAADGTKIQIDIHRKKREAVVVPLPFFKRIKK